MRDHFKFEFYSGNKQTTQVDLFDITGRKVISENFFITEGINVIQMDVSKLNNGVYVIAVTSGAIITKMRLVKK